MRRLAQQRPHTLAGRVAVVMGGARGVVLATARLLVSRGARVAIAELDGELARGVANDPPGAAFEVDVSNRDSFAALLSARPWLLHAEDAYFDHREVDPVAPHSTPGVASRISGQSTLPVVELGGRLGLPSRGKGHDDDGPRRQALRERGRQYVAQRLTAESP